MWVDACISGARLVRFLVHTQHGNKCARVSDPSCWPCSHLPETSAEATPRGERRRGGGSAIPQCRGQLPVVSEAGQLMGTHSGRGYGPRGAPLRRPPGTASGRTRCTGARHVPGMERNPTTSSGFLPFPERKVHKSSGGRQALCRLKGVAKARAALPPNSRRHAPKAERSAWRSLVPRNLERVSFASAKRGGDHPPCGVS